MDPDPVRRTGTYASSSVGRSRAPPPEPRPKRKTMSFPKLARESTASLQAKEPKLKQGKYSVYKLRWEKLKEFLETRFPKQTFEQRIVHDDHYLFNIPESLSSKDRVAIQDLLDEPGKGTEARSSQSPEPGPTLAGRTA